MKKEEIKNKRPVIKKQDQQDKDIKEIEESYERRRKLTPKEKYKYDLSRIRFIFKLIGFDPKKDTETYRKFYKKCLLYFEAYPYRTKVGDIFWDFWANEKDQIEIKGNIIHKRVFQMITENVIQRDIELAYKYEKKEPDKYPKD